MIARPRSGRGGISGSAATDAIALAAVAYAVLVTLLTVALWNSHGERIDRLRTDTEGRALLLAGTVDGVLRQVEIAVLSLVHAVETHGPGADTDRIGQRLSRQLPAAGCLWLAEGRGAPLRPPCLGDRQIDPRPVTHDGLADGIALALLFDERYGLILIRRDLDRPAGGEGGAVWAAFDAASLLGYDRAIGGDPVEALVTPDGAMVAGPELLYAVRAGALARRAVGLVLAGGAPTDASRVHQTPDLVVAAVQLRGFPLVAVTAAPTSDVLDVWWDAVAIAVAVAVLVAAAGALLLAQLLRALRARAAAFAHLRLRDQALAQSINAVVICRADADLPIVYANEAFERNTGYAVAEVIGRNPRFLQGTETAQPELAEVRSAIGGHRPVHVTLRNFRKDGSPFYNDVSIAPVRDETGAVTHYIGVQQDVTERVEAERALVALAEQRDLERSRAEEANRAKSDFLACMSHELRTPLNAILGFSEIIRDECFGQDLPRYSEYAGDIHDSGAHLLDLINDILDLSKIEAGRLDLNLGSYGVERELRAVERLVRQRVSDHRHTLTVDFGDIGGRSLYVDSRAFRQVLFNLLSNSVKFTPDGGRITVRCRVACDRYAEIAVSDTGIGIPADRIHLVRQPFVRLGDAYTRRQEGTGLGLSLVDRLVTAHGGTVSIESAVGVGTTVAITVPFAPAAVMAA